MKALIALATIVIVFVESRSEDQLYGQIQVGNLQFSVLVHVKVKHYTHGL